MQKKCVLQLVQYKESLEINKQLSSHSKCFIKFTWQEDLFPGRECLFFSIKRKDLVPFS